MGELKITGGDWSAFKCPKPGGVAFSPKDQRGQWLVGYHGDIDPNDGAKYAGDIAVFYGENAEGHAKLFAESRTLQTTIDRLTRERDEYKRRIDAAELRLKDLKAAHSRWYDDDEPSAAKTECLVSDMECIAYSARLYLDGMNGPNRPDLPPLRTHTPTTGGQGETKGATHEK